MLRSGPRSLAKEANVSVARPSRAPTRPTLNGSFPHRYLHGRAAQEIGLRIIRGVLRPGDPLPVEMELSARMGIGRPAVREAIKILAGKGLVFSRQKSGTRVRPRQDWNFLDADVLTWQLQSGPTAKMVRELFELRRLIEPAAAELAAARAPAAHVARLTAAYREMAAAGDDGNKFLGPDMRFHRTILEAANNDMLRSLATVVDTALSLSLRLSVDNPRGQRFSLPLHKAVLDAIRRRDTDGARRAMIRLIDDAESDVRRVLKLSASRRRKRPPAGRIGPSKLGAPAA